MATVGGIAFICERTRLEQYQYIKNQGSLNYKEKYGLRWLLRKLNMSSHGYYNFLKDRKAAYREQKSCVQRKIVEIYHLANGVPGYRMMRNLLIPYGFVYSNTTIYKYMRELGIRSVVCRKKPGYKKGKVNMIFPNLINQNFDVTNINKVWCTDFIYLFLTNGMVHYNCTIIDLKDRSVIASLNGNHITSELAIQTIQIAIIQKKD